MRIEFLPCHRCGSNKLMIDTEYPFNMPFVRCQVCGLYGQMATSVDMAIKLWNDKILG